MAAIDLDKINDSEYLLKILIQVENVLDSLDCYVFANWFDGEVVEGPIVRRHWVTVGLLYPYSKMPDPRAALRMLKHGVQVEFNGVKRQEAGKPGRPDAEPDHKTHWLVKLTVPRRLLADIDGVDLELYGDEVNPDDVTAARDLGLDDQSAYETDQHPDEMQQPNPMQPNPMQPMQQPAQGQPNAPAF